MVTTKKPDSVMITIRDRKTNKSTSFTVYNATIDAVKEKVKKSLEKGK